MNGDLVIRSLSSEELAARLPEFAGLLQDCVEEGASIGFVLPFMRSEAEAFWRERVMPGLAAGQRLLLAARQGERLVGSVQLNRDTPANQPHRADVTKLLVHPTCRRRGVARALMLALEEGARSWRRTLLTLDTRSDDAAEPLYRSLGFETVGRIPGYCLDVTGRRLDATTVMYKSL